MGDDDYDPLRPDRTSREFLKEEGRRRRKKK
jgi:hypothetical protein